MGAVVVAVAAAAASWGGAAAAVSMGLAAAGSFGAYMLGGLAGMAVSMVGGALIGVGAKPKSSDLGTTATDRKLTLRSSIESRKRIYGTVMVSGPLVLKTTTGTSHEYLHLVVPVAAGKVTAMRELGYDGTLATASRISKYNRANVHLGSIRQTADTDLVAEVPGWTTEHRGRGIAYMYARLKYDTTAWPNGIKNVQAVVQGHALYDPRLPEVALSGTDSGAPAVLHTALPHGLAVDDEIYVLGHQTLDGRYAVDTAPTTTSLTLADPVSGAPISLAAGSVGGSISKMRWSNNFALCVLDYLLYQDGLNASMAEINRDTWIAAANVSDEQVMLGAASLCTADAATDVLTLAEAVPWQTGLQVRLSTTGELPGGIQAATSYAWIRITPTTGKLATTKEDALYALGINISSAGTGAHTISAALSCTVNVADGTQVTKSISVFGTVSMAVGDVFQVGDTRYRVVSPFSWVPTSELFSASLQALCTPVVPTSASSITLTDNVPRDSNSSDDADQDAISPQFGWETGDGVQFFQGTPPAGLALGTTYYWIRLTNASGQLAATHDAAIAGAALTLADAGTGLTMARVSQPRYTINGQLDLGNKPIDNLDKLLTAGGGMIPYVQGRYRLHAAAAAPPTFDLTASDLRANIKVLPRPAKRDLYNAVRGTFVDPTQLWQPSDLVPQVSEQYQAEDCGEQIFKDIELPYTTDNIRGQRILKIYLEDGRQGMTVDFPARLTAGPGSTMEIAPWDVGRLHIAQLGFDGKLFRCASWKLAQDFGVDLHLKEYAPAAFDWSPSEAAHLDYAPNTALRNAWDVATPTGLTLSSGAGVLYVRLDGTVQPRLRVGWLPPADAAVLSGGTVEIQSRPGAGAEWSAGVIVPGDATSTYLLDVQDGVAYDVRLRARNILGAYSAWVQAGGHTVQADSTPPPDVTGLTAVYQQGRWVLVYDAVADPRSIVYIIRRGPRYGAAQPMGTTPLTQFAVPGPGTYLVKASTGTAESITPVAIVIEGADIVANLIATLDEAAEGWSGECSGGVVPVAGELRLLGQGDLRHVADLRQVPDVRTLGGISSDGAYQIRPERRILLDTESICNVLMDYAVVAHCITDDLRKVLDFRQVADLRGEYSDAVDVRPQIRTLISGEWTAWRDFLPGQYAGQGYDFRVLLRSLRQDIYPALTTLTISVDVPDRVDRGRLDVPVSGARILYGAPFHDPRPKVVGLVLDAQGGEDIEVTGDDGTGFNARVKSGGEYVARTINWIAQGY